MITLGFVKHLRMKISIIKNGATFRQPCQYAIVTDNDSMGPSKRRSVVMSRIFMLKKIFSSIDPFPAKGFPIDE